MSETLDMSLVPAKDATPAHVDAADSAVEKAMAGHKALPVPDAEIYPGLDDDALMRAVYKAWMSAPAMSLAKAAQACGADEATVMYWAERGDWVEAKRRAIRVRLKEEALELDKMRLERRAKASIDQLNAAETLREKAEDMMKNPAREVFDKRKGEIVLVEDLTPQDLNFLAATLKASSDITGRHLGIAEPKANSSEAEASAQGSGDGKTPLVVVVKGGGVAVLPPGKKPIDV